MKSSLPLSECSSDCAGELLSALADSQLGREDVAALLQHCRQDETLIAEWDTYHLIGDVLRSPGASARGADTAFISRLSARLAAEPMASFAQAQAAPAAATASPELIQIAPPQVRHHRGDAANDGAFRWKLVAGLASLAAVSAIAWNASSLQAPGTAPQLAQAGGAQQIVVASPQGPMVRDARLEELLAAHRQLGGGSALEAPSGFLRNATFEPSQNTGR